MKRKNDGNSDYIKSILKDYKDREMHKQTILFYLKFISTHSCDAFNIDYIQSKCNFFIKVDGTDSTSSAKSPLYYCE